MGILDVDGARFTYPFPTQSRDIDIGYPKFARNTNQFLVFDYLDWTEFDDTGKADSRVLIYDIVDKTFEFVGLTNISDNRTSAYGVPSFSGDDEFVIHQVLTDSAGFAIQVSIDDYLASPSDFDVLNPFDVAVPFSFRNGTREVGANLNPESSSPENDGTP